MYAFRRSHAHSPYNLFYVDDDYAVSVLASLLNKSAEAAFFRDRGVNNPFKIYNNNTGFMEARNANGSWAGEDAGWTEGDKWAYSFDVVQDVDRLIEARGGKSAFVKSLDEHFYGGQYRSHFVGGYSHADLSFKVTTITPTRSVPTVRTIENIR